MDGVRGKTAIITGGSSGIGFAIAQAFAREGIRLLLAARDPDRLRRAVAEVEEISKDVVGVPADVSRAEDVRRMVGEAMNRYGRIDVLVNNAGIGRRGNLDEMTEDEWHRVIDINLTGVFLCTQAVFPHMKRQQSGFIINISSLAGKMGIGSIGAYCASKFGVIGLTQATLEEGTPYNIKASAICPGYVDTPMVRHAPIPPEKMIRPDDIAKTALYLLSLSDYAIVKEIVVERREVE